MINPEEFLKMSPGVPFASRVFGEWMEQVDDAFIHFVVANAKTMGEYKLRHAIALVRARDLPELRMVMKDFLSHEHPGYQVAASAFFQDQYDNGFIPELPEGMKDPVSTSPYSTGCTTSAKP